jgi:hypothetical protein
MIVTRFTSGADPRRRIAAATALACGMLLLFAPASYAEPITISCGFGSNWGETGSDGCEALDTGDGFQSSQFEWGEYLFELTLFNVDGTGNVNVTDNPMSESQFQFKLNDEIIFEDFGVASHLGNYVCIPMVAPNGSDPNDAPCRDFAIDAEGSLTWQRYEFKIDWSWDSHNNGYDGSGGLARVLRDFNDDGFYDEDMCLQAGRDLGEDNYVPCEYSQFPFIISGDTDFSTVTPAIAAVPEPGALALVGSGLIAMWYRKRRTVR